MLRSSSVVTSSMLHNPSSITDATILATARTVKWQDKNTVWKEKFLKLLWRNFLQFHALSLAGATTSYDSQTCRKQGSHQGTNFLPSGATSPDHIQGHYKLRPINELHFSHCDNNVSPLFHSGKDLCLDSRYCLPTSCFKMCAVGFSR